MKKNQSVFLVAAVSGMVALCSCAKEVMNSNGMERDSRLTVLTRSDEGNGSPEIATPLRFYVFNDEERCVAIQTSERSDTPLSIELPEGEYDVYAVGGADESLMTLPSQDEAEKSSVIRLKEGKDFNDLMIAHAPVTLSPEGSNTLTLGLERKVCLITSVSIKGVPDNTESVSVSISPLYESILLNGRYEGGNGTRSIPLVKQADGSTWAMADCIYLLPSADKPTISIIIDNTTFSYTCEEEISANHKISIDGTYTGQGGLTNILLSGTVTGDSWEDEQTISFIFNKDEHETDNGSTNESVPEVGSYYQGCYVLTVSGKQAIILSSIEEDNVFETEDSYKTQKVTDALKNWSVPNISANWELPDYNLLQVILAEAANISPSLDNKSYAYMQNALQAFIIKNGKLEISILTNKTYLRPVARLTFE